MPDPYIDPPRPASSPESNAARTGLIVLIMTPLVAYRIVPLFMQLVGIPADNQPGYGELLVPAMTGGIVGALAWIGTTLRNIAYAKGGTLTNVVGKMLPVAFLMLTLTSCHPAPRATELAALRITATVMQAANQELGRECPTESIVNNPELADKCIVLSDQNMAAQQAIVTALDSYQAAVAGGAKEETEKALASLRAAVCYLTVVLPGISTNVEGLRQCGAESR